MRSELAHEQLDIPPAASLREKIRIVVFESSTPHGRLFDLTLIRVISASIARVMFDSITALDSRFGPAFECAEWGCSFLFTVKYAVRLQSAQRRRVRAACMD